MSGARFMEQVNRIVFVDASISNTYREPDTFSSNYYSFPPIITLFPPTVYILCLEYNCLQGKVTNGLFFHLDLEDCVYIGL